MMIEKIILDYLNASLDVTAHTEKPSNKAEYVLIEKTGGSQSNHINHSTIAIQSYGSSLYRASALNEQVKTAMENAATLPEIGSVRLNSNYNYSNTARKEHRYQAVFEITHY